MYQAASMQGSRQGRQQRDIGLVEGEGAADSD